MEIKVEDSNGKKKYWVNGTQYNSIAEIPAEFQEHFVDKDNNGMPDQFDDLMNNAFMKKHRAAFEKKKGEMLAGNAKLTQTNYSNEEERSSIAPTLLKIVIGVIVIAVAAWIYFRSKGG